MKRFLIGQYGGYDGSKTERDFRMHFYGMEACLFEKEEDVALLAELSRQKGFRVGVHYPMRAGRSQMRDALFLAQDEKVRTEALEGIRQELEFLRTLGPEYVLFHYPKPVILDDRLDWSTWRFADEREYVLESQYPIREFAEKSEELFRWLSGMAEEYDFTPVLEFDGVTRYIYDTDMLDELLGRYPAVRLCLDTARINLQDRMDPRFDGRRFIRRFAGYVKLLHLSNLRFDGQIRERHEPVFPEQRPENGWAPIADYLAIVREENPDILVHFEHRSDRINEEELERCYSWVDGLLNIQHAGGSRTVR
ncbi:sugar phosphate isomerase/epimerase family protein [Paenibacillus piri]|uniref:Sugar phosphate isomerase/epimerase n=1 Tax=Paenibacillus piri TaxID=2547395 RepID=A0A4V2ZRT0_9BACL|nr:TIM barrel protein [Paenibacillus piri]TDF89424.1 sugar phosphate isomerase/epimerase [Paenibacillus piri]